MKMNRLFSFDQELIAELNETVARGFRSKVVNDALREKLQGSSYTVKELSGRQLLAAALQKEDLSDFLKRCIKSELGIEG